MFSECSRHGNLILTVLLYFQVNTIAWNESGEYLLSGADDCHLNIYRPSNRQVTYSLLVHLITLFCRIGACGPAEIPVCHYKSYWYHTVFLIGLGQIFPHSKCALNPFNVIVASPSSYSLSIPVYHADFFKNLCQPFSCLFFVLCKSTPL